MVANLQAGFSNSLPVIKIDVFIFFRYKFHWNLFPWVQIYIDQHWSGQLLSTEQATSHYFEPMTTQPTDTKYWGQNRMVANLQAAFSNSLPVIKIDVFNFCPIYISLKSFPMSPNIHWPALVLAIAWYWTGDKPLFWTNDDPACWHLYVSQG